MQSHTSTPWISQYIINPKIDLFLKELDHSEKPVSGNGLCNGYSHLMLRADLIGESEQFIQRLRKFAAMDDDRITKMALLLKKYQRQFELKEYLLRNNLQEAKTENDIREIRAAHHAKNKTLIHDKLSETEKSDLQFAEELIVFIDALLFCASPDDNLGDENSRVNQEDLLEALQIIPPDKLISSATLPIKEAFKVGFTFTDVEFNEVLEKFVLDGDKVLLHSNQHVIYLKKEHGVYTLYDSNCPYGLQTYQSSHELLNQIKKNFGYDPKKPNPYISIRMMSYEKSESKQDRPKPLQLIKNILAARADKIDINVKGFDGTTALYVASRVNDVEIVKELLERKADPNVAESDGTSPLHMAAAHGHAMIAELLLKHGANPNVEVKGITPLAMALVRRTHPVIELLVTHKADLNKKVNKGSLIVSAIMRNNKYLTEYLIDHNADLTQVDSNGSCLLHVAASAGNKYALAKLLEKKADVNTLNQKYGVTALMLASIGGHNDTVEFLIKNRADLNIKDKANATALMSAACEGHLSTVELLMQFGAQVTTNDVLKLSSHAALKGHLTILKYFSKTKPEEFTKSKDLVATAARCLHIDVVRWLAESKFSLEESEDGFLPIHLAACNGDIELLDLLAEYKVDMNKPDINGCTPASHAVFCGRADFVAALGRYGVNLNQMMPNGKTTFAQYALDSGDLSVLSALADHGVDISKVDYYQADKRGWNILDRAARDNNVELFNLLSKHHVNLDFSREDGKTPILIAAKFGNSAIVKLLAEYKGIDVNAGNKVDGMTAMHRAAEHDNVKVLEALDEVKGVDFNKKNKAGFTPFYNAMTYRNEAPTEFFLNRKPEAVISTLLSTPTLSFLTKNFLLRYQKQIADVFLKFIFRTDDAAKHKELIDLACSGKNALSLVLNHTTLSDDASRLFKKPTTMYNGKPVSATLFEIILKVPNIKLEDCRKQLPKFEF